MRKTNYGLVSVLTATVFLLSSSGSHGQTPAGTNALVVCVKTDRTNALYACGEQATFTIGATGGATGSTNGPVAVGLTFSLDGGKTFDTNKLALGEPVTISRTLEQPGFLRCDVTWKKNGKTASACAAAAFDPEKIRAETMMPADFDAFWANAVARMAQIPLDLKIDEMPSCSDATVRCQKVSVRAIDGTRLYAFLGVPANRKPPFPLIVLLPGAGYGPRSPGWVRDWARKGAVALNIGIHAFDIELPAKEVEAKYVAYKNPPTYGGVTNREAYLFYRAILGVDRMIKYGMSRPDVDPKRVVVNGSSQGGGLTLMMAGLNPGLAACAANVPALCDHGAYRLERSPGWPLFVPTDDPARDVYLDCSRYYDTVNFARKITCPALVSVGFIDGTCHPSSVLAAYNEIRSPKRLFTGPLQGHDTIRAYGDFVEGWLMEQLGLTNVAALAGSKAIPGS